MLPFQGVLPRWGRCMREFYLNAVGVSGVPSTNYKLEMVILADFLPKFV